MACARSGGRQFNMLAAEIDAFSIMVIVRFEETIPSSMHTPPSRAGEAEAMIPQTIFFGSVGTGQSHVCYYPVRPTVKKIDDLLFKIRHSRNINGVFCQLPLFEPPIIDPALLVQAAAQGVFRSATLFQILMR
ncbi:hypothetical protein B0T26DRAFT_725467 [Lasiosphaeria miniovina]|uniref:Uncharacterized protein n=1 Tax=Lasiosphaeria miniovina TaxID=1954250 RepID=A0AA39ZYQ4_9PEZI|nr:uncharacterized protein B0T26DRAFT_725467 [Lasiosphaeria miniovina]KAK0706112.1 hypothetical protein B0T26DRAFT_725467 [Lasiosphaeria miniovina]